LLQFAIERIGVGPIYRFMSIDEYPAETTMQPEAILKFLADSSRYLGR